MTPSSPSQRPNVNPVSGLIRPDEIVSSATHALGLVLFTGGTALLVVLASLWATPWHIVSFSIYGASLVLLYGTSTVYHAIHRPRIKRALQVADHSAIFLLIAGTYTPFTLVPLNGGWGWSLFGVVWGFAVVGIVLKLFFTGRFERLSTIVYIGLGWLAVIAIVPLVRTLPVGGMAWLVAGGVAYTVGALFYLWDRRVPYFHTVFHLFVLAGSLCHFFAVLFYVLNLQHVGVGA